jgi:hypothetical protein
MPTRLEVLLQSRKSAAAGLLHRHAAANASIGIRPAVMRAERGDERRESFAVMQRSYIKSLTISRGPAGPVNGRERLSRAMGNRDATCDTHFCAQIWQNL